MQPRTQPKPVMFAEKPSSTADLPPRAIQLISSSTRDVSFARNVTFNKSESKLKSARTFDAGRILAAPRSVRHRSEAQLYVPEKDRLNLKRSIGQQVAKMMQWGDDILDLAQSRKHAVEKKQRINGPPGEANENDEKARTVVPFREAYSCPFLPGLYDENCPIDEDLRETSIKPVEVRKSQLQACALRT
mmetsp:Transcript_4646/g.9043  ORF Transcript_4646/g.9043 Transcript_4646/m.9043 type:complete len:189 (-) Transcript_4646:698-1264(-)